MLDAKLTSVLPRRILAFALDFGIVGLLSAFVARSQFETFPADSSTWTAAQLNRIRELAGPLSRQQDLGDTKYVIPGGSLLLVVAIASVLALIIFVLLPASAGWTPGKRLLGLRAVDLGGDEPTMSQYLTRAVVGLIDVLPVIIPGLLGFVLAGTSTHRQRLGDRLAGTLVIDAKSGATSGGGTARARRSIDIEERLESTHEPRQPEGRGATEPDESEPAMAEHAASEPSTTSESSPDLATAPPADDRTEAEVEDIERLPDSTQEPDREPETPVGLDVSELVESASPVIDPVDTTTAATIAVDLDFEAPAPTVRTDRSTLFSATASPSDSFAGSATRAFSAGLGEELGSRQLPPAPMHRLDPSEWDHPRAEPAPVWRPASDQPLPEADDEHRESGVAHDPSAVSHELEVDRPEPSEAAPEAEHAPDSDQAPPVDSVPTGTAEPATTSDSESAAAVGVDPVWNEQWQAWLFWDHTRERWLRHDIEADRWVPLS